MTAPTFTCDRCGRNGKGEDKTYQPPREWRSVLSRLLCYDCQDAVRRDIEQFAGEGGSPDSEGERGSDSEASTPHPPSPVPATPSLVERLREWAESMIDAPLDLWRWDVREAADRIEELEAALERTRQAWVNGDDPDCEDVCLTECKGPCEGEHRPADLASDDRLIPLPGGRVAVAAQDLRVGDVVDGDEITSVDMDDGTIVIWLTHGGKTALVGFNYGTLVLLDKAAES